MIRKSDGPFFFKLNVFIEPENKSTRELTLKIMDKLKAYNAVNIKDTYQ